jgi:hypothetical protein
MMCIPCARQQRPTQGDKPPLRARALLETLTNGADF